MTRRVTSTRKSHVDTPRVTSTRRVSHRHAKSHVVPQRVTSARRQSRRHAVSHVGTERQKAPFISEKLRSPPIRRNGDHVRLQFYFIKAEVHRSFNTTTVREQHHRSHHKGAANANATGGKGRVQTGDRRHPVLCPSPTRTRRPHKIVMHRPDRAVAGGADGGPQDPEHKSRNKQININNNNN